MRITNEQERSKAYERLNDLVHAEHMNSLMGPNLGKDPYKKERDELCGAIQTYEESHEHTCPVCSAPEIRQPNCLECPCMKPEDFI